MLLTFFWRRTSRGPLAFFTAGGASLAVRSAHWHASPHNTCVLLGRVSGGVGRLSPWVVWGWRASSGGAGWGVSCFCASRPGWTEGGNGVGGESPPVRPKPGLHCPLPCQGLPSSLLCFGGAWNDKKKDDALIGLPCAFEMVAFDCSLLTGTNCLHAWARFCQGLILWINGCNLKSTWRNPSHLPTPARLPPSFPGLVPTELCQLTHRNSAGEAASPQWSSLPGRSPAAGILCVRVATGTRPGEETWTGRHPTLAVLAIS